MAHNHQHDTEGLGDKALIAAIGINGQLTAAQGCCRFR